jgi:hypothetical protein
MSKSTQPPAPGAVEPQTRKIIAAGDVQQAITAVLQQLCAGYAPGNAPAVWRAPLLALPLQV